MLTRREFIKSGLISLGVLSLPILKFGHPFGLFSQNALKKNVDKQDSFTLNHEAQNRTVWAWLRMFEVKGDYGVPTSELAYKANLANVDVVMPLNGGKLQANGTWQQESWKIDPDWPQSLPGIAKSAGHGYMPAVGNDREGILDVLDSPDLQLSAAENLLALATYDRFDAPWDGVYLDLEGIPSTRRQQLSDFYYLLSEKIKPTGLSLGVSVAGHIEDIGTHNFSVVAEVADFVDIRCYGYWSPLPRSIGPYWWLEACTQFALDQGIDPAKLTLGLGNFSKYWPDSGQNDSVEIPFDLAIQLIGEAGSHIEWIECNQNGLIRESFATLKAGHMWIHDGLTIKYGLNLVNQLGLLGAALFAPGMGDGFHWQVIGDWRKSYKRYLPLIR